LRFPSLNGVSRPNMLIGFLFLLSILAFSISAVAGAVPD
jgi:uncharacterized membrane protein